MTSEVRNKGYLDDLTDQIRYYLGHYIHGRLWGTSWNRHGDVRRKKMGSHYRSFIDLLPPYLDSTLSVTASQSANNLRQALLPKGSGSISVIMGRVFSGRGSTSKALFTKNDEMSDLVTEQFRQFLDKDTLQFFSALQNTIGDFTVYGNGVMYLHLEDDPKIDPVFIWLPFWDTCFEFDDKDVLESVFFEDKEYSASKTTKTKLKFYKEGSIWVREKTVEKNGESIAEETYRYPKDVQAVFVAREGRFCNTQYGYGAGYLTLNYTKQLNWASDQIMYSSEKATDNAYLMHSSLEFSTLGHGRGVFDPSPRSVVAYSYKSDPPNDGLPPFSPLGGGGADVQYLSVIMATAREQLQSMFFVDPVLTASVAGSATARTATEIETRAAQALILYRGKSLILTNEILTPVVYSLLSLLGIKAAREQQIRLKYSSLESKRSKQESIENFVQKSELKARATTDEEQEEIESIFEEDL